MPADAVDPGIDEEWEHEAVERAAHEHAGEERDDEIDLGHRWADELLTARTYPVGGAGSRPGSDQRAVMREGSDGGERIPIRPGCYTGTTTDRDLNARASASGNPTTGRRPPAGLTG